MALPLQNPDGSVTLRSAPSGPLVTVAGLGQLQEWLPLVQQDWAIAPLTGNDEAAGTLAAPLRTGAEFTRRTYRRGLPAGTTTLNILEAFPPASNDYILIDSPQLAGSSFLLVRGATPATLASGSLTARTTAVSNVSLTTVQATVDLTPFVNDRIRITQSATAPVGTLATVLRVSAGVATLSQPYFADTSVAAYWPNTTSRVLSVGDEFVVERPIRCCPMSIVLTGINGTSQYFGANGGVVGLDLSDVDGGEMDFGAPLLGLQFYDCRFPIQTLGRGTLIACNWGSTGLKLLKGALDLFACALVGAVNVNGDGDVGCYVRTVGWGGKWQLFSGGSRFLVQNTPGVDSGLSLHQWPAGPALQLQDRAIAQLDAQLWGTSTVANTYGIDANTGCMASYSGARKMTIAGTLAPVQDVRVGGVALPYASVPNFNTTNGAGIVVKTS